MAKPAAKPAAAAKPGAKPANQWQAYVDTSLVGTGNMKYAAILGADGSVWAISKDLKLAAGEAAAIKEIFQDPSKAFASGIRLAGTKHICIRADKDVVIGKVGTGGCSLFKSNKAIIVGIWDNTCPKGAGACNLTVGKVGDYMKNAGF